MGSEFRLKVIYWSLVGYLRYENTCCMTCLCVFLPKGFGNEFWMNLTICVHTSYLNSKSYIEVISFFFSQWLKLKLVDSLCNNIFLNDIYAVTVYCNFLIDIKLCLCCRTYQRDEMKGGAWTSMNKKKGMLVVHVWYSVFKKCVIIVSHFFCEINFAR